MNTCVLVRIYLLEHIRSPVDLLLSSMLLVEKRYFRHNSDEVKLEELSCNGKLCSVIFTVWY